MAPVEAAEAVASAVSTAPLFRSCHCVAVLLFHGGHLLGCLVNWYPPCLCQGLGGLLSGRGGVRLGAGHELAHGIDRRSIEGLRICSSRANLGPMASSGLASATIGAAAVAIV